MEPNETKELRSWEDLKPNQEAVELFDDKEHVLEFLSDRPRETESKKFKGKKVFLFDVKEGKEEKTLVVSSLRLALKLKQIKPLNGSLVSIRGTGKGTDRDYIVKKFGNETGEDKSPSSNVRGDGNAKV